MKIAKVKKRNFDHFKYIMFLGGGSLVRTDDYSVWADEMVSSHGIPAKLLTGEIGRLEGVTIYESPKQGVTVEKIRAIGPPSIAHYSDGSFSLPPDLSDG